MKVNLTTLGCPKNIVDSEIFFGGLVGEGIELVEDCAQAETIILNTCGFIQGAKEESIEAIWQAVDLKRVGSCKRVFVTGCLSQRYHDELVKEIPEVDGFYGNRDLKKILKEIVSRLDLKRELLGERHLTTPRHFAYLKISEGCENPCTFCSIPAIRGKFDSRPLEDLVREAERLVADGVQELILIAQDSTIYGRDRYGEKKLVPLLDKLCQIRGLEWIRLLYTFPANFSDDLVEIISDRNSLIKYVDMPIQHISDFMLRRMARKVTRRDIEDILYQLRSRTEELAIRTTLMVGFPGETDAEYQELADFVEETKFDRLGVFAYSREENTPAYHFPRQVPEHVKRERFASLTDLQTEVLAELNQALVGTSHRVLFDEFDEEAGTFVGRTFRDCPEIDLSVQAKGNVQIGSFHNVRITGHNDCELQGVVETGEDVQHPIELTMAVAQR